MEDWKSTIHSRIADRNQRQCRQYEALIGNCRKYVDCQLQRALKETQAKTSMFERENIGLETRVRELEAQLSSIYKEKSENVTALLTLKEEKEELGAKLDVTSRELNTLKARLVELDTELKESDSQVAKLTEVRAVLSSELQGVKEKLDHIIKQNLTLKTENEDLLARMIKMKDEQISQMNEINEYYESVVKQQKAAESLRSSQVPGISEQFVPQSFGQRSQLPSGYKFRVKAHEQDASCCAFNDGGTILFTAGGEALVKMWDPLQCIEKKALRGLVQPALSLDISAGTELVLAGSSDKTALVWNFSLCRVKHTLTGHTAQVTSVKFFSGKKMAVTGSQDRTVRLWDIDRGYSLRTMTTFSSCHSITLSPEDSIIASGHYDGHVRLWSSKNGEIIHDLPVHDRPITCVVMSPDGSKLVTNSVDSTLCVINMKKFAAEGSLSHPDYHCQQSFSKIAFSASGKYVLAGGNDGKIFAWDTETMEIEEIFEGGHTNPVTCVSWRPHTSQFTSVDTVGGLVLWSSE